MLPCCYCNWWVQRISRANIVCSRSLSHKTDCHRRRSATVLDGGGEIPQWRCWIFLARVLLPGGSRNDGVGGGGLYFQGSKRGELGDAETPQGARKKDCRFGREEVVAVCVLSLFEILGPRRDNPLKDTMYHIQEIDHYLLVVDTWLRSEWGIVNNMRGNQIYPDMMDCKQATPLLAPYLVSLMGL